MPGDLLTMAELMKGDSEGNSEGRGDQGMSSKHTHCEPVGSTYPYIQPGRTMHMTVIASLKHDVFCSVSRILCSSPMPHV